MPANSSSQRALPTLRQSKTRHLEALLVVAISGCYSTPLPPPAPPPFTPENPLDNFSNGAPPERGMEVSIDTKDGPREVRVAFGVEPVILCASTPCVTRLEPGAYDLFISSKGGKQGRLTVQIPRKPTDVIFTCVEGSFSKVCSATVTSPADGKTYQGVVR